MNITAATPSTSRRFLMALGLAALLAIAGTQTSVMAYDGYGTGTPCTVWAQIKSAMTGVDCHYLMGR